MYCFKSLTNQDIIISPKELNKLFNFLPGEFSDNNILINQISSDNPYYDSIRHLYYSNYLKPENNNVSKANLITVNLDETIVGDIHNNTYDNFLSTTLNPMRNFPKYGEDLIMIDISKSIFGDHIKPKTFKLTDKMGIFTDNGEGVIMFNPISSNESTPVGNIIYEHGLIFLFPFHYESDPTPPTPPTPPVPTFPNSYGGAEYGDDYYGPDLTPEEPEEPEPFDPPPLDVLFTLDNIENLEFKNSYTIYESLFKCELKNFEFNFTTNKTLLDSKTGELLDFAKNKHFQPYITTIGFYNEDNELLFVGKLAQPVPKSKMNNMNIIVNIDRT